MIIMGDENKEYMDSHEYEDYIGGLSERFSNCFDKEDYKGTYELIIKYEELLDNFNITDFIDLYVNFENNLGKGKADKFKNLFKDRIKNIELLICEDELIDSCEDSVEYFKKNASPRDLKFLENQDFF